MSTPAVTKAARALAPAIHVSILIASSPFVCVSGRLRSDRELEVRLRCALVGPHLDLRHRRVDVFAEPEQASRELHRDGGLVVVGDGHCGRQRAARQGSHRGRWLNNRAEHSHQPFRRREGAMARFRDIKTLQKFAAVHASIYNHFNHQRHLNRRAIFKQARAATLLSGVNLQLKRPRLQVLPVRPS